MFKYSIGKYSPGKFANFVYICITPLVNALSKVVGFLRVLRFPHTGNVDRVGLVTVIGLRCCGDPGHVAKLTK